MIKPVQVRVNITCPRCEGAKRVPDPRWGSEGDKWPKTNCPSCQGRGVVEAAYPLAEFVECIKGEILGMDPDDDGEPIDTVQAKLAAGLYASQIESLEQATQAMLDEAGIVPPDRRPHIVNGEFQSDKYPSCPPGKVPLSVKDKTAQDLLWIYAGRRRKVDAEFGDDLEWALRQAGYVPPAPHDWKAWFSARLSVSEMSVEVLAEQLEQELEDVPPPFHLPGEAPTKPTSGSWVKDAETLLEIGAKMIDARTVRGILDELRSSQTGKVRYVLRYKGVGDIPSEDYAQIISRVAVIERSPRMLLVEGVRSKIDVLLSELSNWVGSESTHIALPDARSVLGDPMGSTILTPDPKETARIAMAQRQAEREEKAPMKGWCPWCKGPGHNYYGPPCPGPPDDEDLAIAQSWLTRQRRGADDPVRVRILEGLDQALAALIRDLRSKPVDEGRPYSEQSAEWRAGYDEAEYTYHRKQKALRSEVRAARAELLKKAEPLRTKCTERVADSEDFYTCGNDLPCVDHPEAEVRVAKAIDAISLVVNPVIYDPRVTNLEKLSKIVSILSFEDPDDRERAARWCEVYASMLESGAGPVNEPSARLRQAARNIRSGEPATLWTEDMGTRSSDAALPYPSCGHSAQSWEIVCTDCEDGT